MLGIKQWPPQVPTMFFKVDKTWPLFVYFCPFLNTMTNIVQKLTINGKSIDGELGIRTWDCIMVGEDESTEL